MAKSKPAEEKDEKEKGVTAQDILNKHLKANKGDHYNFEKSVNYKVPCSSLLCSAFMEGGIEPGAHRAMGVAESGKTSSLLDFLLHFLRQEPGRKGLYVKSEGRLSDSMIARSGVKFVYDVADWVDGTCYVLESNIYELVFDLLGDLIRNNDSGTRYFVIIDSMDTLIKRADAEKSASESSQVAGGALLTSTFLKKTSLALSKRGHICWFISQYREAIQASAYAPSAPRQGNSSGGHAQEHAGNWVLEFLKPRAGGDGDVIRESDAKEAKPIGHWCRAKVHKSPNEKTNQIIKYPIKYGRTNGNSVWVEYEIADLLIAWKYIEKKGAWFIFSDEIIAELKSVNIDVPESVQGMNNLYALLESNKELTKYLFNKFLNLIK